LRGAGWVAAGVELRATPAALRLWMQKRQNAAIAACPVALG